MEINKEGNIQCICEKFKPNKMQLHIIQPNVLNTDILLIIHYCNNIINIDLNKDNIKQIFKQIKEELN